MKAIIIISVCALLVGCSNEQQDTAKQGLDKVGNEVSATYNKVRDEVGFGHPAPPKKNTPQPRYCYEAYQDVLCYSRPIPGAEYRLVGYQDATGNVGYVLPGTDKAALEKLKVVDVGPPPAVKGVSDAKKAATDDTQSKLKEVQFDPAEFEPKELVPPKPQ